ncbi:hypothetical protein AKJ65_07995 [candidate division MSBL1 archaeon SCGC-AAA259E19]|uniref:Uncharacterized protein n=1 Tax=candidate division MSBL1 archaeon SCGC-AAA259E19 TaxID=1698264 RepID=A0A133UD90_9EURY|nr:hypothetical protein AKJ65_07995 [candidate division MSBL1 archaeon SCGC-AAA259E19]
MIGKIILYTTKETEPKTVTKIHEKLFGKIQKSNYGRYEYEVEGILPKDGYVRPVRAVIIVKKEHHQKVTELFDSHDIKYRVFEIKVNLEVFKKEEFF